MSQMKLLSTSENLINFEFGGQEFTHSTVLQDAKMIVVHVESATVHAMVVVIVRT